MRLGLKFMLAFLLGNALLAAVYGYLAVRREVRLFRQMADEEAESVGPVLANVLPGEWRKDGTGRNRPANSQSQRQTRRCDVCSLGVVRRAGRH